MAKKYYPYELYDDGTKNNNNKQANQQPQSQFSQTFYDQPIKQPEYLSNPIAPDFDVINKNPSASNTKTPDKEGLMNALEGRIPHANNVTEFLIQNPSHVYDVMGYPTKKQETPTVSNAVSSALAKLQELRQKQYTDPYGDELDRMISEFNNRKAFEYNMNTDQLFLNAREQYVNQGQKAMRDAMGAASAMTGGYGNSYAAQVGNQAYQQYLQELNNSIPDFYNSALNKYNSDVENDLAKINLLNTQRNNDYGMWLDQYQRDIENAAFDYDLAASEEAAEALKDTTVWDRLSDEDKMKYTLEYAKLGLNPDGSPLSYVDASGNVVGSSSATIGNGSRSKYLTQAQYEGAIDAYEKKGESGLTAYIAGLEAQGVGDEALTELHDAIYNDEYGYVKNSLGSVQNQIINGRWKVDEYNDGGVNWFEGINGNRRYINPLTGVSISVNEIISKLVKEGMTEEEAKQFVLEKLPQGKY